jgi:hypothetical protein
VRQVSKELRDAPAQAAQEVQQHDERLLELTRQVGAQARQVQPHLHAQVAQQADGLARRLAATIATFVPRGAQVIAQPTRRVLQDAPGPASEKLVSRFAPHPATIRKGQAGTPVESGRVRWLGAVEGGIITPARVLAGHPDDAAPVGPRLDGPIAQFGRPPTRLAGDGKLAPPGNEPTAQQRGVKQVVWPRPGRTTPARRAHAQQRWCRKGRDWRAGMEGRIRGHKRQHGLRRGRSHGDAGLARRVGRGGIAQHEAARASRQG